MSTDLAVIRFAGVGTAVERYAAATERSTSRFSDSPHPRWTRDVGFVERHHNGRLLLRGTFAGHYLDVDESDALSQSGAGEGAVGGGLLGVLLGPPGIAIGLLTGAIVGARLGTDDEQDAEPETLAERFRESIPVSSSAIVLVAPTDEVDELLAALGENPGEETIRRTLDGDEMAALEASLGDAPRSP